LYEVNLGEVNFHSHISTWRKDLCRIKKVVEPKNRYSVA
jgi:hypothetical protein